MTGKKGAKQPMAKTRRENALHDEDLRLVTISTRAKRTYALIKQGRFYMSYSDKNPATIKELVMAGLIRRTERPMVLVAAYVPCFGYKDYVPEKFES